MLHSPRLLLLDEPTAGVDPQARRDFWEEIHRLSEDGLTVLVSTHYMDEAERCDRIVYINLGKIIAHGTVADVIEQSGPDHVPDRRPRRAPSAVATARTSPASSMSRSSARRCMSAATTARRSKTRSRRCAA